MTSEPESEFDWQSGRGLMGIADPAEVDAAFERGEPHVGTAIIGLVLNCGDLIVAAPRIERALRSDDPTVRQLGWTAAGHAARLFHRLTPAIYDILHAEGSDGVAEDATSDILTYVPFREMPGWLKRVKTTNAIRRFVTRRWMYAIEGLESAFEAFRHVLARWTGKRASKGGD